MNPKLKQFAKVMLASDYPEFETMLRDQKELSSDEFVKKYAAFDEEYGYYDAMEPENIFTCFAQDKKRLDMVDWPGEYEEGETADVIDKMLEKHWNRRLNWDADAYYMSVDASKLNRGDHPLLLFKALDEHLKTIGFRLVSFNIGADCYHFGVLPKDEFEKVEGLSWEHYDVGSIDEACRTNCGGDGLIPKVFGFLGVPKTYFEEVYERLCSKDDHPSP